MKSNFTVESIAMEIFEGTKLTKEAIAEREISREELKQVNARVKELRAEARNKAFHANNNVIVYKDKEIAFNPKRNLETVENTVIDCIVWGNFDKNANIIAHADENNRVVIDVITRVGEKSKAYEVAKDLVAKTKGMDKDVFVKVTEGMTYPELVAKCEGFNGYKIVSATSSTKAFMADYEAKRAKKIAKAQKEGEKSKEVA